METNVNYTIVGGFVIILTAAIILAIIWLSSGFSVQSYKTYKIYMTESVTGLTTNASVEYNGVNVGSVTSIKLNQRNPQLVELLIDILSSTPITQGTRATLNSRGLTGISFLALKDRGTDMTPLVKLPSQPYPIIKTAPSLFLRMDTALTQLSESLRSVSTSISSVLDKDNVRQIKLTIQNLQQLTGTLAHDSQYMTTILQNTAKASGQFTPFLNNLNTQTLPATNQMMINLDSVIDNLSEVSTELKQNPSILIRGKTSQPLGPGEQ